MTENDKKIIINCISRHLPRANIYLFGSRARKDATAESDIDIAIDNNQKIDSFIMSSIKDELEQSLIPFTVDIVDLNAVSKEFKKNILQDGKLWK